MTKMLNFKNHASNFVTVFVGQCLLSKKTSLNVSTKMHLTLKRSPKVLGRTQTALLKRFPYLNIPSRSMFKSIHKIVPYTFNHKQIISALYKNSIRKISSDSEALKNLRETLPVIYRTKRTLGYYKESLIATTQLRLFEKAGILLPFFMANDGILTENISGLFTLSPKRMQELLASAHERYAHSAILTKYIFTVYGGPPIQDLEDLLFRIEQLFTLDSYIAKSCFPIHVHGNKHLFALLQHNLSLDFFNLVFPSKALKKPSNMNLKSDYLSPTQAVELSVLQKTHSFIFKKNKDEIIIINPNEPVHEALLKKHNNYIYSVMKQKTPDGLYIFHDNNYYVIPFDVKLYGEPETNVNLLSSFSSISPKLQLMDLAMKMLGQLKVLCTEKFQLDPSEIDYLKPHISLLEGIIKRAKKRNIPKGMHDELFLTEYHDWSILFFNDQSSNLIKAIYPKIAHKIPSMVVEADPLLPSSYKTLCDNNPDYLDQVAKDIAKRLNFENHYPSDITKYNHYDFMLAIMSITKDCNLIENYYKARELLTLTDAI